jgi:hypothetical protein
MQQSEDSHQAALCSWIERVRARYPALKMLFAIPNGGFRHKATAGKLKATGARAGVPDLFLAAPRGGYAGLFIEMKKPATTGSRAGVTSPAQREWIRELRAENYRVEIAFGWEQASEFIKDYLA